MLLASQKGCFLKLQNNLYVQPVLADLIVGYQKRAKSTIDFIYKIETVLEESDASHYWLVIIRNTEIINVPLLHELLTEANELRLLFTAPDNKIKQNRK